MAFDRPTIRQLEYVVAVAEHKNFSRAAKACGVSQPALSAQIQEVEQRLGTILFERSRSGVTVPSQAEPVIAKARQAIGAIDAVMISAADQSGELIGEFPIGVIPTMAPYLLPTVVADVRRRHPRAQPLLREEQTDVLVRRISRGEISIGILADPVPGNSLEVVEISVDPFHLAMAVDHPLAGREPLGTGALVGLEMLLLEDGHCLRDQAIDVCASVGSTTTGSIQATSLTTLCQMVAAGRGVTLLPACSIELETRLGSGLTSRPLRDPVPHRTIVMAWRPSDPNRELYARLAEGLRAPIGKLCDSGQP